ncbi:MAG: hypothetical protein K2Q03_10085 [Sphingobacteriaceae bacterium]|nr:hypothetical protein [Sphingobacteriaceae bacterium]
MAYSIRCITILDRSFTKPELHEQANNTKIKNIKQAKTYLFCSVHFNCWRQHLLLTTSTAIKIELNDINAVDVAMPKPNNKAQNGINLDSIKEEVNISINSQQQRQQLNLVMLG